MQQQSQASCPPQKPEDQHPNEPDQSQYSTLALAQSVLEDADAALALGVTDKETLQQMLAPSQDKNDIERVNNIVAEITKQRKDPRFAQSKLDASLKKHSVEAGKLIR